MKKLVKFLSLFLLAVVVIAVSRSIITAKAVSPNSSCPVLGSNLIDNINPNVLVNLRTGFRNAKGADSCWISATFLMRTPDFQNQEKLDQFFKTAAEQKIQVVIRVASDNSGDLWQTIDSATAENDAKALNAAIDSLFPSGHVPIASFGNEVNLHNEWGGNASPESYAESLYRFASLATNFKVSLAPMSYCGVTSLPSVGRRCAGIGIDPLDFLSGVKKKLNELTLGKADQWIAQNIDAYSLNVSNASAQLAVSDFQNELTTLVSAGFKDAYSKMIVITELSIPDGGSATGIEKTLWDYYKAIVSSPHGGNLVAATTYVRDPSGKVHAFFFVADNNGNLVKSGEYPQASINLGGSTSHGTAGIYGTDADVGPTFAPLGMFEACPPEIPTDSKFPEEGSPQRGTGRCNVPIIPEPEMCKNPPVEEGAKRDAFCSGDEKTPGGIAGWCYQKSCAAMTDEQRCDKGNNRPGVGGCGKFIRAFCRGEGGNYQADEAYKKVRACTADQDMLSRCAGYYQATGYLPDGNVPPNSGKAEIDQGLPACVPTYNPEKKCVSECGEPITFKENLVLNGTDCLRSGNCAAQIGIRTDLSGNNHLGIPFAGLLADYFIGTLDAEHTSGDQLDNLQKIIRAAGTDASAATSELFNKAGVGRKLLPADYQDKLKCGFINYVKEKKDKKLNTKYVEKINGALTGKEMMVYDKRITEIECPPEFASSSYPAWQNRWGRYWTLVPLFPNDESQGKIEFASPTLYSTRTEGTTPSIGPIYVSIPEIQRLNNITALIQSFLIPRDFVEQRKLEIDGNPKLSLPTFGKELKPLISDNACTPSDNLWKSFYSQTDKVINENFKPIVGTDGKTQLTEYQRGVECGMQSLLGQADSQICTLGPNGQIRCHRQEKPGDYVSGRPYNFTETVQVRTVFPHLFDISEQTINKTTGFLRIFNPDNTATLGQVAGSKVGDLTGVNFENPYDPIPAEVSGVQYYITSPDSQNAGAVGLAIDDSKNKETGWKLFFYKLGGLVNAKKFVVEILRPKPNGQ